ncbi:unnamed protein product [Ixodes hexagonus]
MGIFDDLLKRSNHTQNGEALADVLTKSIRMLVDEENQRLEKAASLMAESTNEETMLVLCDSSALSKMVSTVQDHARGCQEDVILMKVTPWGFAARLEFRCQGHTLVFDSSSKVGDLLVVDCSVAVAFVCSEMLRTQFEKFLTSAEFTIHVGHSTSSLHKSPQW